LLFALDQRLVFRFGFGEKTAHAGLARWLLRSGIAGNHHRADAMARR
jgi:hypothetical protein